jgi:hypothetical protein
VDTSQRPDEFISATLRLPRAVRERLSEVARTDRRTVNLLIEAILTAWLNGETYRPIRALGEPAAAGADPSGDPAAAYRRGPGRPVVPKPALKDDQAQRTLTAFVAGKPDVDPLTLRDDCAPNSDPNYAVALRENLILMGWRPATRLADGASVLVPPGTLEA